MLLRLVLSFKEEKFMRLIRNKILYAIIAALFSGLSSANTAPQPGIQDTDKAVKFFEEELNYKTNPYGTYRVVKGEVQNVTIVDVRSERDFAEGHIPGAINIPFEKYSSFDGSENSF